MEEEEEEGEQRQRATAKMVSFRRLKITLIIS